MSEIKQRGGRPPKYTEETVKVILDEVREGVKFNFACEVAGISRETGNQWRKHRPGFLTKVRQAQSQAVSKLLRIAKEQNNAWKILKSISEGEYTDEETVNLNDTKAPDLSDLPMEKIVGRLRRK